MVSELLAWNSILNFYSEPRASLQRTEKFTLDFRNLPLRNMLGKYSHHIFQLEQSISFRGKRNWVKIYWLAVLLGQTWSCFIVALKVFSNLNLISLSDDCGTGAVSEPLVSHIRKALHTQLYITWDITDLISNILLLSCWNRHLFWGTSGFFL